MGLLDADAEELKNSAKAISSSGTGSGRKVNQSGLGAFKGLSKYSNLTAKYRSPPPSPSVEQSRGTTQASEKPAQVSANSVQSECEVSAEKSPSPSILAVFAKPEKSVQSECEVGANPVQSECKPGAKSVQISLGETTQVIEIENISENQSQCEVGAIRLTLPPIVVPVDKSATSPIKSVQSECEVGADLSNSVQTQCDVGAKSVQPSMPAESPDEPLLPQVKKEAPQRSQNQVSAKSVQSRFELRANSVQSPVEVGAPEILIHSFTPSSPGEVRSQVRAPVGAKLVRSPCKLEPLESITALAGAQRIVIEFLFDRCLWNNSLVTPPITKQQLIEGTQLLEDTALSAIKRLRKKAIIDRYAYKDGQAGWTQYQLADDSYRELLHLHQYSAKSVQSQSKVSSKVGSEVSATPSSSSSFNKSVSEKLLTTENLDPNIIALTQHEGWSQVDYSPLRASPIHFTREHLEQIRKEGKLSHLQVQESINAFAYDMGNQEYSRTKRSPLNFFMAIVKVKGEVYQSVVPGYQPPENLDLQDYLTELETKNRSKQELLKTLFTAKFEEWFAALTGDQINIYCGWSRDFEQQKEHIKTLFKKYLWLEVRSHPQIDAKALHLPSGADLSPSTQASSASSADGLEIE
ncbi:hypothetical protein WDW37_09110 [Bdellovibrionota bacterium FG-1]